MIFVCAKVLVCYVVHCLSADTKCSNSNLSFLFAAFVLLDNYTYTELILWGDLFVDAGFGIDVLLVNDVPLVKACKDVHEAAPVPVICNTSAVVNMTRCVNQDLVIIG